MVDENIAFINFVAGDLCLASLNDSKIFTKTLRSNPEQVCSVVATIFEVGVDEVGLLDLQERTLKFLFPLRLQTARGIPLSSSATAAETALSMKASIFNDFAHRKHDTIFEVIAGLDADQALRPIQKLMSAPVIYEGS